MELKKEQFEELLKECEVELDAELTISIKNEIKRCLRSIKQQEGVLEDNRKNLLDIINKRINSHDFHHNNGHF